MAFASPLRYPGGKGKLAPFIKYIIIQNKLENGVYVEPYAGGAGVACSLLLSGIVRQIIINDADRSVWAFWKTLKLHSEELCDRIHNTVISIDEWKKQKAIQNSQDASIVDLGFSTFFLNRTNVSGVLTGGVIGGYAQQGTSAIDARFNKVDLINRIRRLAALSAQMEVYNMDAVTFLDTIRKNLNQNSLIYLDPPYFVKGQALYRNYYTEEDHKIIATRIKKIKTPWICSYDNAPEIRCQYKKIQRYIYDIGYSARRRCVGKEVIFFSRCLEIPEIESPFQVKQLSSLQEGLKFKIIDSSSLEQPRIQGTVQLQFTQNIADLV